MAVRVVCSNMQWGCRQRIGTIELLSSIPVPSVRPDSNAQRLTFASAGLLTKLQSWVDNPGDNHGLLLRTRDEAPAAADQ